MQKNMRNGPRVLGSLYTDSTIVYSLKHSTKLFQENDNNDSPLDETKIWRLWVHICITKCGSICSAAHFYFFSPDLCQRTYLTEVFISLKSFLFAPSQIRPETKLTNASLSPSSIVPAPLSQLLCPLLVPSPFISRNPQRKKTLQKSQTIISILITLYVILICSSDIASADENLSAQISNENVHNEDLYATWSYEDFLKVPEPPSETVHKSKIKTEANDFFNRIAQREKRKRYLHSLFTTTKAPTAQEIGLKLAAMQPVETHEGATIEQVTEALRISSEYVLSKRLENIAPLKSLLSGWKFNFNPFGSQKQDPQKPESFYYTVEPAYYKANKTAGKTASLVGDRYTIESSSQSKPVYRVVPVFEPKGPPNGDALGRDSEDFDGGESLPDNETFAGRSEHPFSVDTLKPGASLSTAIKDKMVFTAGVVPVSSKDGHSATLNFAQKDKLYEIRKNTSETQAHQFFRVPFSTQSNLSHEVKGGEVSITSLNLYKIERLPADIALSRNNISEESSATFFRNLGLRSHLLKSTFDKDAKVNKVEYEFKIRF